MRRDGEDRSINRFRAAHRLPCVVRHDEHPRQEENAAQQTNGTSGRVLGWYVMIDIKP